jgi:predicted  nucleic acid-binding Zn-ribbon protein
MNELQVRLTGDITALQSALTKAKNTIKSFEDSTNKESEKGNVGFKRKIGLIEQLTNKSKALRTALSKATNEKDIARYNQELEQTIKEMTRLNALGKSVSGSIGSTSQSFKGVTQNIGSANGVAQEFSRIIQDAPFGIIGIGNNLQQLAANFASTSKQAGGAGAAIKASLGALISPANLLVLGISAVTAAFTAYQMGAFDFLKSNEEAAKSVKELADELESANADSAVELVKINALREVIEDETQSRDERLKAIQRLEDKYPSIFSNADKEKLLNGQLVQSYELLTKAIVQRANASLAEQEIPNLVKQKQVIDSQIKSLDKQIATEEKLLNTRSKFVGRGAIFSDFDIATAKINDLSKKQSELSLKSRGLQINIEGYSEAIIDYTQEFEPLLGDPVESVENLKRTFETLPEFINEVVRKTNLDKLEFFSGQFEAPISATSGKAETQGIIIPEFASNFEEQANQIQDIVKELSGSFTGLGALIGKAFDNTGLGQFVGEFLRFASQLIAANFKIATANAVTGATNSALATGPGAALTLPAFIAGAVGLVASAFSAIGGGKGGGGGGGGASSGLAPQIFTNKNTTGIPSGNSPNFNSGSIDFANQQSRLFVDVSGDKLRFILDRERERRGNG